MDVALLWFQCMNPDCNFIPVKTKKEKIERYWKHGHSIMDSGRPRMFMRYVEGYYQYLDNGSVMIFHCKHGSIVTYDYSESQTVNSYYFPLLDKEMCTPCLQRIENEKLLNVY